ncbi:hypothetical protein ACLB2K_041075 [Fragaria x ananassa]
MEETQRDCYRDEYDYAEEEFQSRRGRERMSRMPSRHVNASIRKGTRSLSPLRIPDIMFDDVVSPAPTTSHASNSSIKPATSPSVSSAYNTILSAISFSKVNKKWKLRDMLLFRSASEGRAMTGKDPLRKYSLLSTKKSMSEDVKNSSFRSTDSVGSVSSRRRGPVSPHELHYTVNRAVTEEMRRKTVLPYKHGLLGCLGFNHGLHEISRGYLLLLLLNDLCFFSWFSEVAELRLVWWLEIKGYIDTNILSPRTTYAAYLVYQIPEESQWGFLGIPMTVRVTTNKVVAEHDVFLADQPEDVPAPQAQSKGDGWMEIELGEISNQEDDATVEFRLRETESGVPKGGLFVEGIQLRPKLNL